VGLRRPGPGGDHQDMSNAPDRPTSRLRPSPCWLLLALALVAGCDRQAQAVASREEVFENQNFRVVSIDLKREALSLHWKDPDSGEPFGTINALRQWGMTHSRRMLFAANAGIYDRQFAPLGLYVENGKTAVPLNLAHGNPASGNFSLLPNGVFAIYADGHAAVQTSTAFKAAGKPVQWASQSGPMLVIDGKLNEQFIDDSNSLKWRSGVCAKTPHHVVFAVSEAPVNFHTFARLFKEELGCRDALYLDGTISQFYVDGEGYAGAPTFMVKPYAGIFAVFSSTTP
jgi:uncharacterized protein YigE (DUF2233 family)